MHLMFREHSGDVRTAQNNTKFSEVSVGKQYGSKYVLKEVFSKSLLVN
jgi:hypothetical protein